MSNNQQLPYYYCLWFAFLSFLASGNPQQPRGNCLSQDRSDSQTEEECGSPLCHRIATPEGGEGCGWYCISHAPGDPFEILLKLSMNVKGQDE